MMGRMKNLPNVIALGVLAAVALASGCQDDETPYPPYEEPLALDVTHGAGGFVAVHGEQIGEEWDDPYTLVLYHSPDGKTWTRLPYSGSGALYAVAYGNQTYVAVGGQMNWDTLVEASTVMISADGQTWEQIEPGAYEIFTSIAFGNGRFMAVARDDEGIASVFSSVDGRVWGQEIIELDGWDSMQIRFAGDRFLMHGRASEVAMWRAGEGWSVTDFGATEIWHLQAVGDEIVGIGGFAVSFSSPDTDYQFQLLRYTPSAGWSTELLESAQALGLYEIEQVGDHVLAATVRGIAIADDVAVPLPWDVVYDDIAPQGLAQGNGVVVATGAEFAWSDDGGLTWQPGVIEPAPGTAPAP
jgi:hypothetical protein